MNDSTNGLSPPESLVPEAVFRDLLRVQSTEKFIKRNFDLTKSTRDSIKSGRKLRENSKSTKLRGEIKEKLGENIDLSSEESIIEAFLAFYLPGKVKQNRYAEVESLHGYISHYMEGREEIDIFLALLAGIDYWSGAHILNEADKNRRISLAVRGPSRESLALFCESPLGCWFDLVCEALPAEVRKRGFHNLIDSRADNEDVRSRLHRYRDPQHKSVRATYLLHDMYVIKEHFPDVNDKRRFWGLAKFAYWLNSFAQENAGKDFQIESFSIRYREFFPVAQKAAEEVSRRIVNR
jgi:hypothetical protein